MTTKKLLLTTSLALSTMMASISVQAQDFYTSQIITVASTYCPRGTVELNGQILQVNQNSALFSLLGTTYGGDGRSTFAVPDMRGRSAIHYGTGPGLSPFRLGQRGGAEDRVLNSSNLPGHTHLQTAHDHPLPAHSHTANLATHTGIGDTSTLVGGSFATYPAGSNVYATGAPDGGNAAGGTIVVDDTAASTSGDNTAVPTSSTGGSRSFQIRDPYLTLRSCMVTNGIYPSRN